MIYVLLPVYNEEGALPPLLAGIRDAMLPLGPYEVVAVNDGSSDGSKAVLEKHRETMPVSVVDHGVNRGLGVAMKTGFDYILGKASKGDVVVSLDADNSHDPALIPEMLREIRGGANVVIASRFVSGGREVGLSLHRKLLSRGFGYFVNALGMNQAAKDLTCGYRAYDIAVLKRLSDTYGSEYIQSTGFVVMFEILYRLQRMGGVGVVEVPLVLRYDKKIGKSKIKIVWTVLQYIKFVSKERFAGRAAK